MEGVPADAKPIDLGTGRLAASFGYADPALLSLTRVVDHHGVVELTGVEPFDEAQRGRPDATRRHRAMLASDLGACCWLEGPRGERCADGRPDASDPARPRWRARLRHADVEATAAACDDGRVELRWTIQGWSEREPPVIRLASRLGLPALAMITETNPPKPLVTSTTLHASGQTVQLSARAIGAAAYAQLRGGEWRLKGSEAIATLAAESAGVIRASVTLDLAALGSRGTAPADVTPVRRWPSAAATLDPIAARALAYVRGCTALEVRPGERVLLTDHRLLPLSWTRDAYYQALLLLASGRPSDAEIVGDHLRWLWRRCERPRGRWVRSHDASGRRKDLAFQADQQLYPAVELCDYWRATGRLPEDVDWTDAVAATWQMTLEEVDPQTALLTSMENAADDPAEAPFIASSQIVLWYAARRLAELAQAGALALAPDRFAAIAERTRFAFTARFEREATWPYAVDASGMTVAYHDANDLPIALAPLWGFCEPGDPHWRATLEFAWSPANAAWYPGQRGGLGSVHTPGPWTLGDVQDWLVGRVTADDGRRARALRRLHEVAFMDSMLPEAYSAEPDPDLRIRHWFAWPGAVIGALLLLDDRGELDGRLRA